MNIYLDMFLTFAKVGVMTFGGGYAMLPILQREVVDGKGWATEEELMDYYAIGQCTPGVIAVNTATFIGQKLKGIPGGIFATLGVVFPSLVIISLLATVIEAYSHLTWVQHAFGGVRICVCVLILNAVTKLYKKAVVDKVSLAIFLVVALGSFFTDLSPVLFVLVSAAVGILIKNLGGKKGMMLFIKLFLNFFKVGLFAVGGGMATVPFLYELSDATGWYTYNDLANMIAVGESTPGPIGVNMATYVGFVTGMAESGTPTALLGAVVATLGLITPSVIIILIIAAMLKRFRESKLVENAFYGLRPASTGLIAAAGLTVAAVNLVDSDKFKLLGVNWKGLMLGVILWLLTNKVTKTKKLHPIVFIGVSALVGVVLGM